MRKWLQKRKRRREMRRYFRVLPPLLKKSYGKHRRYTKAQVDTAIERGRLNPEYAYFAYVAYCPAGSASVMLAPEMAYAIRQEIADQFFGGDTRFDSMDIADLARSGAFGAADFFGGDLGEGGFDGMSDGGGGGGGGGE